MAGEDPIRVPLKNRDWLDREPLAGVHSLLNEGDAETRVIGGAVRNALLGTPFGDFDLATTLLPDAVAARAQKSGLKVVPTGVDHGTVTLISHGEPFEVTTLREDEETHGRHATVRFGTDWHADAMRRDFTINALSVGPDGIVHDTVGGLADIEERRVRFVGVAEERIHEDYLRILRFFRLHARYGGGPLDAEGLLASIRCRAGLSRLSAERIWQEIHRLLAAPGADAVIDELDETGLLQRVLCGVSYRRAFHRLTQLEHGLEQQSDAVMRLGVLAVRIAEDAERLARCLRLSNADRSRLEHLARDHRLVGQCDDRRLAYELGEERFSDAVTVAWAVAGAASDDAGWLERRQLPESWQIPVFPLSGKDALALGVPKGPAVGETLKAVEEAWIASGFSADPEELLKAEVARRQAT